jgi:hypothetical protein
MRIGVVVWNPGEGIAAEAAASFAELGHSVIEFAAQDHLPQDLDVVFAYGPFGSMVPLATQLLQRTTGTRPAFIFWQIEPLPNPATPRWLLRPLAQLRSWADRLAYGQDASGQWRVRPGLGWLTMRGFRFRYIGDLLWLQEKGLLTLLVMGSRPKGAFLRTLGIDSFQPPSPSYRGKWGADLNLERDVPVLWLGKSATRRRRRLIARMRRELGELGIEMLVIDGVENPYIFGEARTELLNRTCIVLNLLRHPWDSHAGRFQLAVVNRALVISEPVLDHHGFVPGEHFVVAPIDDMARTVKRYLDQPQERQAITDRAYALIRRTPRKAVYQLILERALGPAAAAGDHENEQRERS